MRGSTAISLVVSVFLAVAAVFGVRTYLAGQRDLLAQQAGVIDTKPKNTIVVAAEPLRFGQPIRAEHLKVLSWPSGNIPAGAFTTAEELLGKGEEADIRHVMSAMEEDEPVLASKITGAGQRATLSATLTEGMKAVSIRVNDVLGVAGFVLPGDRVDILLTRMVRGERDGEQTYVDVLLQGVKVLAVDQVADDRTDEPSVSKTVTFEVSTAEAQQLTLAAHVGTLSLTLRNVASSGIEQTQPVTLADLGGGPAAQALKNQMIDLENQKLSDLEKLVRNVGDTLGTRLGSVEDKLNQPRDPLVVEKEVIVEKEVFVDKPVVVEREVFVDRPVPVQVAAPKPDFAIIGVSRNAQREEYRVKPE